MGDKTVKRMSEQANKLEGWQGNGLIFAGHCFCIKSVTSSGVNLAYLLLFIVFTIVFTPASTMNAADMPNLLEKTCPKAAEVIRKPTISRVSELPRLPVSLRQYEFLIDHPRIFMVLAHICDPSLDSYRIAVRSEGLIHVDDPGKLAGDIELVDATKGRRVYFISGHFYLLTMRYNGHVVLMLTCSERFREAGASVDLTTTSYIKVNSAFVGFLAKLMDYLFPNKVDARIARAANAVKRVAAAIHDDPAGTYRLLAASGEISPGELQEFAGMFLN